MHTSKHADPEMRPSFNEIRNFFSHIEGKLFFTLDGTLWTLDKEQGRIALYIFITHFASLK
jgi:hypothetical protein